MRLLLDTHAALWWLAADSRLSDRARTSILAAERRVISAASVWEVAIKRSLGKLATPPGFGPTLAAHGFELLPISASHAEAVGSLPFHHRDPFDRLLVAQALEEELVLASGDRALADYGVPVVW